MLGNSLIRKGTAIATFVNGRYANHSYGNHAAIDMGQTAAGILGQVTLSKKMADSVRRCEIRYQKGSKAGQNEIGIDCR